MKYYKHIVLPCDSVKGKYKGKYFILYKNQFFRNYMTYNKNLKKMIINFIKGK